jgi:predicted nucleic acid-binding protein
VTVIDTSGVVDYLLGVGAAHDVEQLIAAEGELAAPDVLVFEAIAVIRRLALRGELPETRAAGAVLDLGDLPVALFPSMALRERAWGLRANLTVADALFVSLAEQLAEPLATKDGALASAISMHGELDVSVLRL